MKKIISIVLVVAMVLGMGYYFMIVKPYNEAAKNFNEMMIPIKEKNKKLDELIKQAEITLANKEQVLDNQVKIELEQSLKKAKVVYVHVPELPKSTEKIEKLIKELSHPIDYSEVHTTLETAMNNYQTSMKQYKQVINPNQSFIIDRLKLVNTITEWQSVTEDNDPNGGLNKSGGYTSTTYFISSQVTEPISGRDIIDKGTDAGGAIEVYKTEQEARKREAYLSNFDGVGVLNSGSHKVVGTIIIRTSRYLTASQQTTLTQQIETELIKLK